MQNITVRVSDEQRGVIRLPLPEKRAYDLVLRFDPAVAGDIVNILFNRRLVGRLQTTLNPGRVGSYRLTLPPDIVTAGSNENHRRAVGDVDRRRGWRAFRVAAAGVSGRRAALVCARGADGAIAAPRVRTPGRG